MAQLRDGHPTRITFSDFPNVLFYEKSVTPPSIMGGGENDTTTMLNDVWRTRQPKLLKSLGDMSLTAAYDPQVYEDIVEMINVNQQITIHFSDGSTVTFWGWVDEFAPGEIVEGEQPEADVTIIASNQNNSFVEVAPVYVADTGSPGP